MDVCVAPADSCLVFLTVQRTSMFYNYADMFKRSIEAESFADRIVLQGEYIYLLISDRVNYDRQKYSMMALDRWNGKTIYLLKQGFCPVGPIFASGYTLLSG